MDAGGPSRGQDRELAGFLAPKPPQRGNDHRPRPRVAERVSSSCIQRLLDCVQTASEVSTPAKSSMPCMAARGIVLLRAIGARNKVQ